MNRSQLIKTLADKEDGHKKYDDAGGRISRGTYLG